MKLLIISNMSHYWKDGTIVGWGPTVEEIDHLAALFETIRHVGCLHEETAPNSALPYQSKNVTLIPLPPSGGERLRDKLRILRFLPVYISTIIRELKKCDAVHLRCPANIPLLALIVLIFSKKPVIRWAKYAGNWGAGRDYPVFYRFQRWILQTGITKCVVTVNGSWPGQKYHIQSFYNPCLTQKELQQAAEAGNKELTKPVHLLFVGALNTRKGIIRLLEIAKSLHQKGLTFSLDILGDGPDRFRYEAQSREYGLSEKVFFRGWVAKNDLAQYYREAHILILPSESEGWPKVISEGMAYGVVPVAGAVGSIPEILRNTGAGFSITPYDNVSGYVNAIFDLYGNPLVWKKQSDLAKKVVCLFTYEEYQNSVKNLFKISWNSRLTKKESTEK